MANALLKNVRDIFLGPSVYRDDAAADAVQHAIRVGGSLAEEIRNELLTAAFRAKIDISSALDTPLSVIDGGSGSEEPGSLIKATSVGAVAAVGIEELYRSGIAKALDRVLHSIVARSIAAWEVGEENSGQAPSPWQGGVHIYWAPGTLTGGKACLNDR